MTIIGILMLSSGTFYFGYRFGNKYQIGLWTKDSKSKPKGILDRFKNYKE